MDVRSQIAIGIDAEASSEYAQGQPVARKFSPDSLGSRRKVNTGDRILHHLQIFIPVLVDGILVLRLLREPFDDCLPQLRAAIDLFLTFEHRAGKCQTGLFTALPAIGFIELQKNFHGTFRMGHS